MTSTPMPDTMKGREKDRVVIFFREEGFYPVTFTEKCRVEDHVRLNPGTIRVEELLGEIIWPAAASEVTQ